MKKLAWHNMAVDGKMMMDKGTGEVLGPKVDYTCYKEKFQVNFIVFIDHKIKWCKVNGRHALNGIDTLNTWSIC